MSSPRALDPRRIAAAFALALLVAIVLPPASGSAAAEKVRTDPGDLPGYTVEARGAPLSMLLYEPVIPVPVDPGEPHGEGSLSYTAAKLETGPVSRALGSSFWPGAAVGDGFATLCDQVTNNPQAPKDQRQECNEEWRVKADARWPETKQFPKEDEQEAPPTGGSVFGSALGLDTFSRASTSESPNEEAFTLGNVKSRSDTVVEKGKAIATTVASAEDVALGGGVISIESVKTVLEATTNKKKGATSGTTKVSGLVVGGQGYVVDEKGVRPVQDNKPGDSPGDLPEMPGGEEMRKQLGIEIELVKHKSSVKGADASRSAGGLRISINTAVLKDAITKNVPVYDVLGELPEETDELTTQLAPLLALAPQVDFIFGRGNVRAAGVEGLEFDFDLDLGGTTTTPPTAEEPPAAPASSGSPAVSSPTTGGGGGTAAPPAVSTGSAGGGGPAVPSAQPAQAAAPAAQTQAAAAELPQFFGGLPPGLVAVGMVLAALGGRALANFTTAAMTGVTGALCDRGVPRKIPELRTQG